MIAQMMINHRCLCPEVFDEKDNLLPHVKAKIDDIVDFLKEDYLKAFPRLKILDITLQGSLCSHVYHDNSDIDMFIVVDDIFPDNQSLTENILNKINKSAGYLAYKPFIYTHPVDFGILYYKNKRIKDFNTYSVLNGQWKTPPHYQEFAFTPKELYAEYCIYSNNLHKFAAELEKTNGTFLTSPSCRKLDAYLQNLRDEAFDAKENSPTHEYSLAYNLYRLLKKFGTYTHFLNYIKDSYKNNIRCK